MGVSLRRKILVGKAVPGVIDDNGGKLIPQPAEVGAVSRPAGSRPVVAVVATRPETVLNDFARAMSMAGITEHLSPSIDALLKINISWQHWYPACSTTPWQLEGVIKGMQGLGYGQLIPAQNGTVVVDSFEGEANNKHKAALGPLQPEQRSFGYAAHGVDRLQAQGQDAGAGRNFPRGHPNTGNSSWARTSSICQP